MHCGKKLCENMVKTILGMKDSFGSREDMKNQGVRRGLWIAPARNRKELFHMPGAPYILKSSEKTTVIEIIKKLKTPSNYVGAIHKCLAEGKLRYIKSHDFHVLMHQVITTLNFHAW
jgi:hypothetical protein